MDIYDPGLMAGAARADGTSTPTSADKPKTELDENVEKIVGNISNWWSGFAKKSQDSIQQARKEMENRGGIVNYAKSEYAKLESSMGEAQKKARDQSQNPPEAKEGSVESEDVQVPSENSKGKQRALDDQDPSTTTEAGTASNQGPTLGASVSSLFSKLTSDPRLVQLQQSLTTTLQSVGQPKEGEGTEKSAANPIKLQESLSKLSLTIQSHLPHLDVEKSQQLAKRYMNATESFAKEIQSDMKDFVGELVRIVPPEGEAGSAEEVSQKVADVQNNSSEATVVSAEKSPKLEQKSKAATSAPSISPVEAAKDTTTKAAPSKTEEDEEDFAWDEDHEEAAAATAGASAAAAQEEKTPTVDATPAKPTETKPVQEKASDSDEDSDWE